MTDDAGVGELRRRVESAVGASFQIEDEIGRGGMAVVYRAVDLRLRRKVALKVLPPDLAFRADVKSRFVREAQLAAQLSHAHIVPIYAVDETGGIVWFAMGLVDGDPLAKLLHQTPRPELAFVRSVLREVADGLAYAHARGVVHRDVKPDNILIDRASGRALVTDFGIARAAEGDLRLTATGVVVGTPAYMSPEQAMGDKDVDGRADIYALGVVGWQMLAGELPFKSENTPGMLMKHISEPPRALHELRADLPANLVYAIERAMAKGPDDRWPDAKAFRTALGDDAPAPVFAATPSALASMGRPPKLHFERPGESGTGAPRSSESTRERPPGYAAPAPPAKPWRYNPMREAKDSEEGANAIAEWRAQRDEWRRRQAPDQPAPLGAEPLSRREQRQEERRLRREGRLPTRTPEQRIRAVQRFALSYAVTVPFLAMINMFTSPQFPWFIFPAIGMGLGLASRVGGLWVDGIPLRRLFKRQPIDEDAPAPELGAGESAWRALPRHAGGGSADAPEGGRALGRAAAAAPTADLRGVPAELLGSTHGRIVRESAETRAVIEDVYKRLSEIERVNLPDVVATAQSLNDRVRALAQALMQLDRDASPEAVRQLDERIATARAATTNPENDRRLELLERQRTTLKDLAERRATVAEQLDHSGILLQTIKLDMLKLRSSGMESHIADSTMATQEARAIATDIERVVDAAQEARRI
ncbi:MAG: hypothetical protein FJ202_09805 [Gemmatimonadetes bacterium]|nr:hypothetical protein [Gemmatimonadota bacterium]